MEYKIELLDKEKRKDYVLLNGYESDEFYDVKIEEDFDHNVSVKLIRKKAKEKIIHTPEEYDFPDRLYQDYFPNAKAYGIIKNNDLIAVIEIYEESWSNRLRITEVFVEKKYRRKGLATLLMNHIKEIAKSNKNRAIILETQTSNIGAIDFYHAQGFVFDGIDISSYHNDDIKRNEVRLELIYFLD